MNWLKRKIKTRINALGYKVQREYDPKKLKTYSRRPSAGKILEFIGPSAVGKSTLFYAIANELEKDWFLPQHAASLSRLAFDGTESVFDVHRQLLLNRVERVNRGEKDFWSFAKSISYGAQVANSDILMRSNFPRGFALEEGFFQVFSGDFENLEEDALRKIYAGRHLVFMSARKRETIAERRMARYEQMIADGHLPRATSLNGEYVRAESSLSFFSSFAENAKTFGADVVTIFAEDNDALNREVVLDFSERICRKK